MKYSDLPDMPVQVRCVATGATKQIYLHRGRAWVGDGDVEELRANDGLINGCGDGFGPQYIHSELFGGSGTVEVLGDDDAAERVRTLLARHPQVRDTRVFGRCGSY